MSTLVYLVHTIPKSGGFCTTELPYLAGQFDRVVIISHELGYKQISDLPINCSLYTYPLQLTFVGKVYSKKQLFCSEFWKELFWLKFVKKVPFSLGLVFTLLQELYKAKKYKEFIISVCPEVKNRENVVVYSFWMNHMALAAALLKIENRDVKTACRSHGSDLYFEIQTLQFLPYRRLIADNMDHIWFISGLGKHYFENLLEKRSDNWQVAYLGSLPTNNHIMMYEGHDKILLSCSLVTSVKRLDLLVMALGLLKFNLKWIHIGDGPDLENIKLLAGNLPDSIKSHFTGYMNQNEVVEFIQFHKPVAMINVSASEGIPVSMMEAMSVAVPVIATRVGGVEEIVKDKINGLLMPANPDAMKIAETIDYFFSLKEDERLRYRNKAYQWWLKNFNGDINYQMFALNLRQLCDLEVGD